MRFFVFLGMFFSFFYSPAFAGSIEGKIASLDKEGRTLTLETGEVLASAQGFSLDSYQSGQVVNVFYDDETQDITSISVLEAASPVDQNVEEPPTESASSVQ
jgi:hypothetical protein